MQNRRNVLMAAVLTAALVTPIVATGSDGDTDLPRYVGEAVCVECHSTDPPQKLNRSGSASPCPIPAVAAHSRAFEALSMDEAATIARLSGEIAPPTESRICLGCHSTAADEGRRWTADTFRFEAGVQCEACHGPGSAHVAVARMERPRGIPLAQRYIRPGTVSECTNCHVARPSHDEVLGRGFQLQPADDLYKTPIGLAISPGGERLYVVCEHSNSLIQVDVTTGAVVREVRVGLRPHAAAVSKDGRSLYVTNRMSGSVSIVDTASFAVQHEVPVGHEPHGVAVDPATGNVLVAETTDNRLVILDPVTRTISRRLLMGGSPWAVSIDANRRLAFVTNVRPRLVAFRDPPVSEVSVVDLREGVVTSRADANEANMLQGIAAVPTADTVLFTLMRTKNLIPTTRIAQGWVITNGLGLLQPDGRVDQVLLDDPENGFPDAFDVAVDARGRYAVVTSGGADEIAVVDVARLQKLVADATPAQREAVIPNRLGTSDQFVTGRVRVGRNPRAVLFAPDGEIAYVANALDDTVSVVRVSSAVVVRTIDLGGPKEITPLRRGEQLFHDARAASGSQFSCRSCHPDGHMNGLTSDIEADGLGLRPVDNRTLQGIFDTAPFKWEGTNPTLQRQCGPRFAVFFTRREPFAPVDLDALVHYMGTIERPPNRYRQPDGLTPAQRRGLDVFQRSQFNNGRTIPKEQRCVHCHRGSYRTDHLRHVVWTTMLLDTHSEYDPDEINDPEELGELGGFLLLDDTAPTAFDTGHLTNIADSPPYLHNGAAPTLEEIWTRFNITDRHGATADLTRQQLNDLIAYLKAQ